MSGRGSNVARGLLFAGVGGIILSRAVVASAACGAAGAPDVLITSAPTEILIDVSKSATEVISIGAGSSQSSAQEPHKLAISRVTASVGVKANARQAHDDDGGMCATPTVVEVLLAYSERRVFVAKEAAHDACVLSTVLSHALRHARGEELVLDHVTKNYAAHLQKRLAGLVGDGPDQRSAEEALRAKLQPEVDQLLTVLEAGVREAAEKADHPEEVSRVVRACAGSIRDTLAQVPAR